MVVVCAIHVCGGSLQPDLVYGVVEALSGIRVFGSSSSFLTQKRV